MATVAAAAGRQRTTRWLVDGNGATDCCGNGVRSRWRWSQQWLDGGEGAAASQRRGGRRQQRLRSRTASRGHGRWPYLSQCGSDWRGRRPPWHREVHPMAVEADKAREAPPAARKPDWRERRSRWREAGLAREVRPVVEEAGAAR
uniref:Uncharacterized protein n=1 Tax=Oryza nivara TaxID=4536 RepID=A0A0E0FPT5_ORYNI